MGFLLSAVKFDVVPVARGVFYTPIDGSNTGGKENKRVSRGGAMRRWGKIGVHR